jgi:hypothetical protein
VGGALTTRLRESGSEPDLAEAEHVCGLRLTACGVRDFYFGKQREIFVVGTISG